MTDMTSHAASARGEARGVVMMLGATALFALQDLLVKLVSAHASIWQVQFLRSAMVIGTLFVMIRLFAPGGRVLPRRFDRAVLRGLAFAGSYFLFYGSLPFVSLSQAAAAFFVSPLFVVIFARLLIAEPIGPRRMIAIALGFAGVLLIVRPFSDAIEPAAAMPVLGAAGYALGVVLTRMWFLDESPPALSNANNIVFGAIAAVALAWLALAPFDAPTRAAWPFLAEAWTPLSAAAWWLIAGTAATHLVAATATTRAYQLAPAGKIAAIEYSYLLYPPIIDVLVFDTPPEPSTLAGMALIALGGAFVAWRVEGRAKPRGGDVEAS